MSTFESSVKQIPYAQTSVYAALSDLTHAASIADKLPKDKVGQLRFERDSITANVPPAGDITLAIVDRDEPKCVKYEAQRSMVPFTLWVQVLPTGENSCKMKLTLKAELNIMIRGMIEKPLREGLERMADALASLPYGQ